MNISKEEPSNGLNETSTARDRSTTQMTAPKSSKNVSNLCSDSMITFPYDYNREKLQGSQLKS